MPSFSGKPGLLLALIVSMSAGLACGRGETPLSVADAAAGGPPAERQQSAISHEWREGIWISDKEINEISASGPSWANLKGFGDRWPGVPNLSNQDQENNVHVLAKAILYARTKQEVYRDDVREQCMLAIDTELGGRTLALGRELAAYVIAADLVGLEPSEDAVFRDWLESTLTRNLDGRTLQSTHEDRPNNWGTHAGASRAAVAVYLRDEAELDRVAKVFKGWLGDREAYSGFTYGSLAWQSDESSPVGINPLSAEKDGEYISGVIPDDMRRGGGFHFPPSETEYPWEALQGAVVLAEILHRQGYPAWDWEDRAILRAVKYLYNLDQRYPGDGWWARNDDQWIIWLVNHVYETNFPTATPAMPGKNMGWTDWTHAEPRKR